MRIYPLGQLNLLVVCAILGGVVGFLFDTIAVLRGTLCGSIGRAGALLTFIADFFITVFAGCGVILASYYFNLGKIRAFCFLGLMIGIVFQKKVLSKPFKFILEKVIWIICATLGIIGRPIIKFLVILAKKTIRLLIKLKNKLCKSIEKNIKLLYNIYIGRKLVKRSKKGFLKGLKK